jgi:hypothetical protein
MKKFWVLFIMASLLTETVQSLDLQKVNEWKHDYEYWDPENKALGLQDTVYLCTLINNQVLCEELVALSEECRYYIKNYLTGEITYRFKNGTKLSALHYHGYDQYGAYVFLEKDGGLVLFDVKEKREYIPGEPLKRGSEYIFYNSRSDVRYPGKQLLKHNILTDKIEEVHLGNLPRDEFNMWNYEYGSKFQYIGNSQLELYGQFSVMILQLNESMTEVESIVKRKYEGIGYTIPIGGDKYIGFSELSPPPSLDEVSFYYVELLDEKNKVLKEYKDIVLVDNSRYRRINTDGVDAVGLIGRDKQHVLFFDSPSRFTVYVYKIVYQTFGVLNDSRVRIRKTPGLSGEILGVLNRGDKVEILETGTEKQRIDGLESVWYRILTDSNTDGWVFGAYIDITESN